MKKILYTISIIVCTFFWNCNDVTVGYLLVENASYNPDTLVVKKVLDETIDASQIKWQYPWVSTPIEGVEGTAQIIVSVKGVESQDGDVDKLKKVLRVRGNGVLEIPFNNDVPIGHYVISLNFSNEGYSKDLDNCFTIIVK